MTGDTSEEKENAKDLEKTLVHNGSKSKNVETISKTINSPTEIVHRKRAKFTQRNKRRSSINAFDQIFNEDLSSIREQESLVDQSGAEKSKDVSNQMHVDYEEEVQDRSETRNFRSLLKSAGRDKTTYEAISMAFTPIQGRGTLNSSRKSNESQRHAHETSKDKNLSVLHPKTPLTTKNVDTEKSRTSVI